LNKLSQLNQSDDKQFLPVLVLMVSYTLVFMLNVCPFMLKVIQKLLKSVVYIPLVKLEGRKPAKQLTN